mmetsp:Transcript_18266/g.32828  ORF Transcript_18266/g.32828 Transcript_18266/m.32828 type:complete len:144 (+) Transcript_18266:1008-1439(+)
MFLYFSSVIAAYMWLEDLLLKYHMSMYHNQAADASVHEAIELIAVTAIFFVYRAKPRNEFFSLMLQNERFTMPRIIPFYVAEKKSSQTEGKFVVIAKPCTDEDKPMARFRIGVPTQLASTTKPNVPGTPAQPLLARSVELQSY